MTCPVGPWELCGDQTPCPVCPTVDTLPARVVVEGVAWTYDRAAGWHAPEDTCLHLKPCEGCVAEQEREWRVGSWSDNSTQRNAPVDLAEDEGAADHLPTNPEGG